MKIAYFSVNGNNFKIVIMDAYGKDSVSIVSFTGYSKGLSSIGFNYVSLCWSPDGSKIAFNKRESLEIGLIYVINIEGTEVTQITTALDVSDYSLSWSN